MPRCTGTNDERLDIISDGHQRPLQDLRLGCHAMAHRAERLSAPLATSLHPSSPSVSPKLTYQSAQSSPCLSSPRPFTASKHGLPVTRDTLLTEPYRLAIEPDLKYRAEILHPQFPGSVLQPACSIHEATSCKKSETAHGPQSPYRVIPLSGPTASTNPQSSPSLDLSWQNLAAMYISALAGHTGSSPAFASGSGSGFGFGSQSSFEREADTVPVPAATSPWSNRDPAWSPDLRHQDLQQQAFCPSGIPGEGPGHEHEGVSGPRPRARQSCQPEEGNSGGRSGSAVLKTFLQCPSRGGRWRGRPFDALRLPPPRLLHATQTRQKVEGRGPGWGRRVGIRAVPAARELEELVEDEEVAGEEGMATAAAGRDAAAVSSPPHPQQFITIVAGALSRTAAQVAVHPLDTLKTRMQVQLRNPQLGVWRAVMSCPGTRAQALAAWTGAAGARDLLLGLGAAVAGILPASAVYFTAEPRIRSWMAESIANGKWVRFRSFRFDRYV
ncbi:hypothetical protein VaNZ11_008852 [Volvox africanus]|uniref:Uncharacterized protein n=1 Tax=Volvox africanus TaxID=51714 RepID=A0ABQ5S5Y0_9CHLO|nr:hypothetical protein VaNZ11_008852 [Volvox africanus]